VPSCWQFSTAGTLVDPNQAGLFIPPDKVIITSSYGGTATITQSSPLFLFK